MKTLTLLVAFLVSQVAVAGKPLVWSTYTAPLKLATVDDANNYATFTGTVTISGELVFLFEGYGHQAGLLWVRLIPDPGESAKLPQVVAGTFPDRLYDLWVLPADEVLEHFPGVKELAQSKNGTLRDVRRHATLVLTDYVTGAECSDTRGYHATLVKVVTNDVPSLASIDVRRLHGC